MGGYSLSVSEFPRSRGVLRQDVNSPLDGAGVLSGVPLLPAHLQIIFRENSPTFRAEEARGVHKSTHAGET